MAEFEKSYVPPEEVSLTNFHNIITKSKNQEIILIKCSHIKDLEGVSLNNLTPLGKPKS